MIIRKAPPLHCAAPIEDYTNFLIFFLLSGQKVDWHRAGIITFKPDGQNSHDLSTRWKREAITKGTHLGVRDVALTILDFNGGKNLAAGLIKHPPVRAHLLHRMEYEVRKNIGLRRRLRAGEDQTFLVLFEIPNRGIKASLGNKDISQ